MFTFAILALQRLTGLADVNEKSLLMCFVCGRKYSSGRHRRYKAELSKGNQPPLLYL